MMKYPYEDQPPQPTVHHRTYGRQSVLHDHFGRANPGAERVVVTMSADERLFEQGQKAFLDRLEHMRAWNRENGCQPWPLYVEVYPEERDGWIVRGSAEWRRWYEGASSLPHADGSECGTLWGSGQPARSLWGHGESGQRPRGVPASIADGARSCPFQAPEEVCERVLAGKPVYDIPDIGQATHAAAHAALRARALAPLQVTSPEERERAAALLKAYEEAVQAHDELERRWVCAISWLRGLVAGWAAGEQVLRSAKLREEREKQGH